MADPTPPGSVLLATCGLQIDGGIASVARSMARVLDEQVEAGALRRVDRVSLADPRPVDPPPANGRERLARGRNWRFAWELHAALRRHDHELVLFDHFGPSRVLDLPLSASRRRKIAIFTHANEVMRRPPSAARERAFERADLVLANSFFGARMVHEQYPGIDAAVEVVYLCIDPERERRWSAESEPGPAAPRERAVLAVGRMARDDLREKGFDDLLACWPAVRAAVPDATLWIAGRGDDAARLAAVAASMAVGDSVHFLGQLDERALGERMRRAALFVLPSRQEGFGLVFAEAMWHGLPCIGTTADAAAEVLGDGGLLVPFGEPAPLGDSVVALLSDETRRRDIAASAWQRVREHFLFPHFRGRLLTALGRCWPRPESRRM